MVSSDRGVAVIGIFMPFLAIRDAGDLRWSLVPVYGSILGRFRRNTAEIEAPHPRLEEWHQPL